MPLSDLKDNSVSTAIKKSIAYGKHTLTLETGEIARQAGGAVLVSLDDSVVLVTLVAAKQAKPGQDFLPLTVDYQEKTYAAGRIPGGFFKREGRPTEKETLTSRLIDRPVRPLFPEEFKNEVQVIAQVVSLNPEMDGDFQKLVQARANHRVWIFQVDTFETIREYMGRCWTQIETFEGTQQGDRYLLVGIDRGHTRFVISQYVASKRLA